MHERAGARWRAIPAHLVSGGGVGDGDDAAEVQLEGAQDGDGLCASMFTVKSETRKTQGGKEMSCLALRTEFAVILNQGLAPAVLRLARVSCRSPPFCTRTCFGCSGTYVHVECCVQVKKKKIKALEHEAATHGHVEEVEVAEVDGHREGRPVLHHLHHIIHAEGFYFV